jgi:hypothetical protein
MIVTAIVVGSRATAAMVTAANPKPAGPAGGISKSFRPLDYT